ncbi:Cytochrome P450 71D10 [Dendrobium catenatum]|uniref:Cytochrome P450 71D10 n=1 Tax=Dendrobium catenatum TaxID=906689 RepID=A0A2I0VXI1_9ASPA|nr:Cytochrome P450 71D10 [Dendrobium catenatum]
MHQISLIPHRSLFELSKKHGPLMLLQLSSILTLVVSSPSTAREIMRTHDLIFASRPSLKAARILLYNNNDMAFAPYGEYWRQTRKICVTNLLSLKMIQSFSLVRMEEVSLMIKRIARMDSANNGVVCVSEILNTLTCDVLCKSILGDMIVAGTDTSLALLDWCMVELIRNPTVMEKVQSEVRGIAYGEEKVREEYLGKLSYMKAVIKEVLRLHPPVPLILPRESLQDCQIQEYNIPKKTRVLINAWAIGRDGHDFHYIPFGAGRRICPGIQFAIAIVELALANLVYRFNWKLPSGISSDGMDMEDSARITTPRKEKLYLVPLAI